MDDGGPGGIRTHGLQLSAGGSRRRAPFQVDALIRMWSWRGNLIPPLSPHGRLGYGPEEPRVGAILMCSDSGGNLLGSSDRERLWARLDQAREAVLTLPVPSTALEARGGSGREGPRVDFNTSNPV